MKKKADYAERSAGHRERMREHLLRIEDTQISDQNLLEALLFYTIPMRDTNPTAADLCNTFGDFRGVIDASMDALCEVDGVGRYTAAYLKLMQRAIRRYVEQEHTAPISCLDRTGILQYLRARFLGSLTEQMLMLTFNARGDSIQCISLGDRADSAQIDVYRRSLAQAVCRTDVQTAILSHCHPSGVAAPSEADVQATRTALDVLSSLDVHLADHVILAGGGEYCFMSDIPRYRSLFY